ncbi:hypothetical protein I4F81_007410 [Pyropia yezoensis]|uniref:Uncharacterized protein n=1 Tax=Pyropia yezoensis TaxID=2788 RepID=A0ACC3C3I9_PYRYE|nr:hypothetical protein I4F81_007410 [Neopyropia yezoensis]
MAVRVGSGDAGTDAVAPAAAAAQHRQRMRRRQRGGRRRQPWRARGTGPPLPHASRPGRVPSLAHPPLTRCLSASRRPRPPSWPPTTTLSSPTWTSGGRATRWRRGGRLPPPRAVRRCPSRSTRGRESRPTGWSTRGSRCILYCKTSVVKRPRHAAASCRGRHKQQRDSCRERQRRTSHAVGCVVAPGRTHRPFGESPSALVEWLVATAARSKVLPIFALVSRRSRQRPTGRKKKDSAPRAARHQNLSARVAGGRRRRPRQRRFCGGATPGPGRPHRPRPSSPPPAAAWTLGRCSGESHASSTTARSSLCVRLA